MLGGIIPDPSGRRENYNRWIRRKEIEKTEGAEIHLAILTDRGSKANRAWGYDVLEVVLFLLGGEVLEVEYHSLFLTAENRSKRRFRRVRTDIQFDEILL